mmetsp:Transcript_54100/g.128835  ORF Transcript_54100/g.128835 Transcript_54100/m.128835 type:complete len:550 (-) Transcript_54100:80-1729(-)
MAPAMLLNTSTGIAVDEYFSDDKIAKMLSATSPEVLTANLLKIAAHGAMAASIGCGGMVARCTSSSHPSVSAAAVKALAQMGAVDHIQDVADCLESESAEVQAAAANALGAFGPDAAGYSAALAQVVQTGKEERVKTLALHSLGQICASDQMEFVSGFLDHGSPEVSAAAVLSAAMLAEGAESTSASIAERIASKLSAEGDGRKYAALYALAGLGPAISAKYMDVIAKSGLSDPDYMTREVAAQALWQASDSVGKSPECLKAIVALLAHQDAGVRAAAATTLGYIGKPASQFADDVAALLSDEAEDVSWMPLQMGGGGIRPPPAMRKPRCAALVTLGSMSATSLLSSCSQELSSADWEVRMAACEAICGMGMAARDFGSDVAPLLKDPVFMVKAKACQAIGAIKADDEAERLVELFEDPSPSVRAEAVAAVGELGSNGASFAGDVYKLLLAPEAGVRAAALGALGAFGSKAKSYASIVVTLLQDEFPEVRKQAYKALARYAEYGTAFLEEIEESLALEEDEDAYEAGQEAVALLSPMPVATPEAYAAAE